jgi:NitT/TauT family transport system permease protein
VKTNHNIKTKKEGTSAPLTTLTRTLPYVAAVGSLLLIWQIVAWILPDFLMPDVATGLSRFFENFSEPDFLEGLQSSLYRLAWGYPIACLLGALLGLLAGVSKTFSVYLRSVISILQSIPPITWVPFFVVLIGFGNLPIILVITIASFFPMALSVLNATEGVNRTHLEVARVLGANNKQLISKVYGPETLPAFVTGAQVAFGNAWRSLIAAEMVGGASVGLGWSISYAGEIADMEGVLASIVTIGTIAIILDHVVLNGIKRKLLKWRYIGGDEK